MKNIEKGLAEKVMFCIYIDSHSEVDDSFKEYYNFVENLGEDRNHGLYRRVWNKYEAYTTQSGASKLNKIKEYGLDRK